MLLVVHDSSPHDDFLDHHRTALDDLLSLSDVLGASIAYSPTLWRDVGGERSTLVRPDFVIGLPLPIGRALDRRERLLVQVRAIDADDAFRPVDLRRAN